MVWDCYICFGKKIGANQEDREDLDLIDLAARQILLTKFVFKIDLNFSAH